MPMISVCYNDLCMLQVIDVDRSGVTKLRKAIKAMLNSGNGVYLTYCISIVIVIHICMMYLSICKGEPVHKLSLGPICQRN